MKGKQIGTLLRMCREMAGYSQEDLAKLLHSNRNTISRIEIGKDIPEIDVVVAWAKATGTQGIVEAYLSDLLGGSEQRRALDEIVRAAREMAPAIERLFQTA